MTEARRELIRAAVRRHAELTAPRPPIPSRLERAFAALLPRIETIAGRLEAKEAVDVTWLREAWPALRAKAFEESNGAIEALGIPRVEAEVAKVFAEPDLLGPLGCEREETTHTQALAHLLRPRAGRVGAKFIKNIATAAAGADGELQVVIKRFEAEGAFNQAKVYAERVWGLPGSRRLRRTDLWIEVPRARGILLMVIENKIDASPTAKQLKDYDKIIKTWVAATPGSQVIRALLTPAGVQPEGSKWVPLSYADLAIALRTAIEPRPSDEYAQLYLRTILRHVLEYRKEWIHSSYGRMRLRDYLEGVLNVDRE